MRGRVKDFLVEIFKGPEKSGPKKGLTNLAKYASIVSVTSKYGFPPASSAASTQAKANAKLKDFGKWLGHAYSNFTGDVVKMI